MLSLKEEQNFIVKSWNSFSIYNFLYMLFVLFPFFTLSVFSSPLIDCDEIQDDIDFTLWKEVQND